MSFFNNISWRFLLLIILFSILFDNKLVSGQCLTDQRDLLLQLNQSLSSSPFTRDCNPTYPCRSDSGVVRIRPYSLKRRSWSLNTDCCSAWDGVTCDKDGHVIGLDLSSDCISGGLDNSGSLFKLQHLQNLNLAYNSFESRQIPSGFDRLANLTHLNMSNAGFIGQIPIEISRLTRLVSLDISAFSPGYSALKLDDPDLGALVRNLSELRVLRLDGVNISAEGRKWCQTVSSSLPKLQVLSLSNCYLSGPIDKSLLQLQSLNEITLGWNNISAQVPDFFVEFSNLTSLSLRDCGLYGKFPEKIFQLQTLQSLNLAGNLLLHGSLPEFPQNGSLQTLVLKDTSFSGEIPNSIGNLKLLSNLDLGNSGFNGSIPASMAKLDQLQYLDLSRNHFTGLLPSSSSGWSKSLTFLYLDHNRLTGPIALFWNKKFVKLNQLSLSNNSLNGSISPSLFTLPSLGMLDLSQNQFTGQLAEFHNETSPLLDTLDLSSNKLEGPIPSSFFQLSSLTVLILSSNNFNGTLSLDMFQNFRNLSILDLSGNNFSIDTGVANPLMFPQLHQLNLRSCNLRVFPDFLRNQSILMSLDLSSNQICGKVPNWIWMTTLNTLNMSKNCLEDLEPSLPFLLAPHSNMLTVVDLSSNMLQGKNLPAYASTFLDYSNNNFTIVIPHNISSYIKVSFFFSLSSNNLMGEIPTSICECSDLEVLDLSNNNLSGPIPPCLGTMTFLSVLNLGGNSFNGTIPHMFPKWCSLQTFSLNNNRLVGKVARSLANCTMLQVLDLGNNQINDTFPSWLGNMSNLRVLILRSNRFHGTLRHQRSISQNFQMLQIIDISSNNFTGNLSSEFFSNWKSMMINKEDDKRSILRFGVLELSQLYYQDSVTVTSKGLYMELVKILPIFTSIDLSNNRFEGDIPEVLGHLSSLYILNISQNALTGGIPPSFGNFTQLESLDLSQNKLSGEIPIQLAGLTFLSSLNLSYNHLVGKIPLSTQIQSLNATSFEGNDGLCGLPLTKKCFDKGTESPRISPSPSKSVNEFNWMPVSVASGFGVGIGISICLMTFWGTRVRRPSRH